MILGLVRASCVVPALAMAAFAGLTTTAFATPQDDAVASLPGAEAMASLDALVGRWTLENGDGDNDGDGTFTSQTVAWNEDRTAITVEWFTVTESGEQVAGGRGRIVYDDIAGAVLNTYAGRDGDRSFSGSATLISIDGAVSDWRGHETRGSGQSVNFEVTYDLRSAERFLVDFIPTCIDGLDALQPVRFGWDRVDEFLELVPNADDLAGDWVLREGGHPGMPNGSRMSVERGSGGMSLVFLMREPGGDGRLLGVETLWFHPESGLRDLYFDTVGNVMNGEVTMVIEEQPIVNVRWRGQPVGQPPMRITSRVWVVDGELRVDFLDAALDGQRIPDPPSMVWVRP
jgi:hypothetical protein